MKVVPVILSGGSGTRLWPLSRQQHPKQYLPLASDHTMLQETILRLNGLEGLADPMIVCNADHRFLVAEQCQQIGVSNPTILLESAGKNTAPAIAAAALQLQKTLGESLLLVLSADHVIQDITAFHQAIKIATREARNGKLVTFGVVPSGANTGYGYIHKGEADNGLFQVREFVEKPDQATANLLIQSGDYLWNSGMFVFQSDVLIEALNTHSPAVITAAQHAIDHAKQDLDFIRMAPFDFEAIVDVSKLSIDYALMEKSDHVGVVSLDAGWNDIGSWSALYDVGKKDGQGNVVQGHALMQDTTNTYISANHHMVATLGVDDLVIVDTPNATLVSTKDKAQAVKSVVEKLQQQDREEHTYHRKVYRPWGWYDLIETGKHFQVKRLHVNPGAKLSLQMHRQRAEHWVVVDGVATVTNNDTVFTLEKGESTHILQGIKHALENKTQQILEVIEVQSGTYLGEDDIVRFEDIYGREAENN